MIKQLLENLSSLYAALPTRLKNRYVLMFGVFFVYMLFIDKNDFITQFRLYATELGLKREANELRKRIVETRQMQAKLNYDKERFAREKYFVHKPGEDVYVIIRK
jgi:cell division protein DivIC